MKPSELLDKAADWLSEPGRWTQRAMFRGKRGTSIDTARHAQACCTVGAIERTSQNLGLCRRSGSFIRKAIGGQSLFGWNDAPGRTQEEVVAAFRKAAELAREDGQ